MVLIVTLLTQEDLRLLTLTGPGGVGKTRLAVAVAEQARELFPGGIWFVDLAPLADPALVVRTIARVVGLHDRPGQDPAEALAAFLGDLLVLLVLDNLEHLPESVPALEALLGASPNLTILATSREPLRLRREQVVEVHPLPVPVPERSAWTVSELEAVPTVELFVERARAADPAFALSASNAAAVAELSRRLDGLPLAIELAATRVRLLPPPALLARMGRRLPLLAGGSRDLPARQRTMRDAIGWSYDLLTPKQQVLFRRLAVFSGGFMLEGAEAVSDEGGALGEEGGEEERLFYKRPAPPLRSPTVLDDLAALANHSLVQRIVGPVEEEPRYRMLETVREFGLEQLEVSGEDAAVRRRHLAYVTDLAERFSERDWLPEAERVLARLDAEDADARSALAWAEAAGEAQLGLRLAAALWRFWLMRGHLDESLGWLERALGSSPSTPSTARARALLGVGWLAFYLGNLDRSEAALNEGLRIAVEVGARVTEARTCQALGRLHAYWGRYKEAAARLDEALALFRELEPALIVGPQYVSLAHSHRGRIALADGDLTGAAHHLEEGERRQRELAFSYGLSWNLCYLGDLERVRGDLAGARARYRECLALAEAHGDQPLVAAALDGVASVAAAGRQPEQAARLHGAAGALRDRLGAPVAPWELPAHERDLATTRAALGPARFTAAWEAGAVLTPEQAVAEAVADPASTDASPPSGPLLATGLTAREAEVLRLLAEGLSDREIAEDLSISSRTVNGHVTHLLGKLGVDSRTAAVAYVLRHRLVDSSSSPSPE